ncbi:uncharacterized protein LOC130790184 isoform X2 [Actinidia eriantha]|uniref:uncharacterized protein LOC130790184 isoform X2 n=1 Tax=Actinidia eriantha TaxID=165200 RepID=UPI00258BFD30|nr:uncharacterized protein LOC130790184 isoform X2 [Actinidia eriantha]
MAGNEYTPNLEDGIEMVIQVDDPHDQENGHPVDDGATHTTIQVDDSHDQENGHPVDSGAIHTTIQALQQPKPYCRSSQQQTMFNSHSCHNSHQPSNPAQPLVAQRISSPILQALL